MKARVKAKAAVGANKFGAANAANQVLGIGFNKNSSAMMDKIRYKVGLKALEGYFDNLYTTSTNEKTVLEQLVARNAKLIATNKELVAVKKK